MTRVLRYFETEEPSRPWREFEFKRLGRSPLRCLAFLPKRNIISGGRTCKARRRSKMAGSAGLEDAWMICMVPIWRSPIYPTFRMLFGKHPPVRYLTACVRRVSSLASQPRLGGWGPNCSDTPLLLRAMASTRVRVWLFLCSFVFFRCLVECQPFK